jgi:hypothetical protein
MVVIVRSIRDKQEEALTNATDVAKIYIEDILDASETLQNPSEWRGGFFRNEDVRDTKGKGNSRSNFTQLDFCLMP